MKIDVREHKDRISLAKQYFPDATVEMLTVGDYVEGNLGVEWKDGDFGDSIKHHMFQQADELISNFKVPVLMIPKRFSQIREELRVDKWKNPYAGVYGSIASLMVRGIVPMFVERSDWGFELMQVLAKKANDGKNRAVESSIRGRGVPTDLSISSPPIHDRKVKPGKRVPTFADYQLSILTGFPNMSIGRAKTVINEFGSLTAFLNATDEEVKTRVKGIATMATKWRELLDWKREKVEEKDTEWVDL